VNDATGGGRTPRWPRWVAWLTTWGIKEMVLYTALGIVVVGIVTIAVKAALGDL